MIGSLKRYDWEPTNEAFFKTYKNVIQRLRKAPRCYAILFDFNKEHNHLTYEICYHPYYVDLTYFMCGKTVHQMHVARTFVETSKKSLIGTMYHELIAHGSQVVELTNKGTRAGSGRIRIMKQWERELEGNLIKWYAEKEMYGISEIKNVQKEIPRRLETVGVGRHHQRSDRADQSGKPRDPSGQFQAGLFGGPGAEAAITVGCDDG